MGNKAYVVSESQFEYDDNYYSPREGGDPSKVFLDKDEADEFARSEGLKSFKKLIIDNGIYDYGYGDIESAFMVDDALEEFIQEKFGTTIEDWWERGSRQRYEGYEACKTPTEMSDEDWSKFFEYCNFSFMYVTEVEFGGVFS